MISARGTKYLVVSIVTIAVLVISIRAIHSYFTWDYYEAKKYFNILCSDKNENGIKVYEKVMLNSSYFIFGQRANEEGEEYHHLYISGGLAINEELFLEKYKLVLLEKSEVNSIGPIYQLRSYVVRKSDNMLLGESKTYENGNGWFKKVLALGGSPSESCPSGQDENHFQNMLIPHVNLIRNIFSMRLDQ